MKSRIHCNIARFLVISSITVAALAGVSSKVFAQQPEESGHKRPPAEALQACEQKKADDACEFKGRQQTMTGTCWAPEGKPLACKPKHPPGGKGPKNKQPGGSHG